MKQPRQHLRDLRALWHSDNPVSFHSNAKRRTLRSLDQVFAVARFASDEWPAVPFSFCLRRRVPQPPANPSLKVQYQLHAVEALIGRETRLWRLGDCLAPRLHHAARPGGSQRIMKAGSMYLRLDQLPIEFPEPKGPSPNGAAAVQELLGGKFGEMSTLMNYTMQSFNFRGRSEYRPFYDLIANIAAEELSHIELVSYTINLLLTGATTRGTDPTKTPLKDVTDARNAYHFLATGTPSRTTTDVTRWD